MTDYSKKELLLIGKMCDREQVELLEKRRRWLLGFIIVGASAAIVLIAVTICFRGCLPDGNLIVTSGLTLGIVSLSIELVDHRLLAAKLLRQLSREAAANALAELRQSGNVRKE